jgi:L-asparaginase II
MATLFASLATSPDLAEVFRVMHRYPALVSGNDEGDALVATSLHAVAKGGAQGCMGVGHASGLGIAVKAWDGSYAATVVGVIAALSQLGLVGDVAGSRMQEASAPPVLGGGVVVGALEPRLQLE